MEDLYDALTRLRGYVEAQRFAGYDPYDALNASFDFSRFGHWGPVLAIQVQKRNPINIRPLLNVQKGINPKAMGLFLYAYSQLYELEKNEYYLEKARYLLRMIQESASTGYNGVGWGYNFDWASPGKYLPAYTPSVVVTAFVARGLFKYYLVSRDPEAYSLLIRASRFILEDLPRTETEDGICISYTPVKKDCCYNASLLGAELLARVYALTNEESLRATALQAVDFVVAHQYDDGHWKYSIDLKTGKERNQVDFHQGFLLDCMKDVIRFTRENNDVYKKAIIKGAYFYRNEQFKPTGRSMWRLPSRWPVDIHHQAQGIITFSKLATIDDSFGVFSERIARWTVQHMQDKSGYFYYRKNRLWTNKIPYMRWGQAWMMAALSQLITTLSLTPAHS